MEGGSEGGGGRVGLGTEFRSEKIPRNRLGMVSVIPRKKVLIPRGIPSSAEEPIPKHGQNRTERNSAEKDSFT